MILGIAINLGTSVETVMEMLRIVKKVLVMSVNPGNAGQMFLPYVGEKITKLLAIKEDMDFEIYWDGACSAQRILEYAPKGVKGFVLGTTLLFGKDKILWGNACQYPRTEILRDVISYCIETLFQSRWIDALWIAAADRTDAAWYSDKGKE